MNDRSHIKSCAECATHLIVEWSEMDNAGLEYLGSSLKKYNYRPGEVIFHQSQAPQGIYCISQGKVLLCQYDNFGNEIGFGVANQGETMGWRSFFAEDCHSATALALTDVRLCLIPKYPFRKLLGDYPRLAQRFLKTLAKDRGPIESLLLRNPRLSARIRLINFLLILCRNNDMLKSDEKLTLALPMNRQQIASLIMVRPETLSRTIAVLRKEGLARFHIHDVYINNYYRLVYESNGGMH